MPCRGMLHFHVIVLIVLHPRSSSLGLYIITFLHFSFSHYSLGFSWGFLFNYFNYFNFLFLCFPNSVVLIMKKSSCKIHGVKNDCHLGSTQRKGTPSCQMPLQKPPCFLKSPASCYGHKLSESVCAIHFLSLIPGSSWRPTFNKERQWLMKSALQLKYTKKIHTRHKSTEEMSWPFERGVDRHIHIPILWNCPRKKK